jgi:hypothetical protein
LFQSSKSGSGEELIKIPKNIFEGKVRGISNESHRKCPIDQGMQGDHHSRTLAHHSRTEKNSQDMFFLGGIVIFIRYNGTSF